MAWGDFAGGKLSSPFTYGQTRGTDKATRLPLNSINAELVTAAEALANAPEAMVSVRGKDRFVVMDIDHYHYLRECELTAALAESQANIAPGRFVKESVAAHMKRLAKLP